MNLNKINVNNILVTGVDNEPSPGSINLVKSGGVYEENLKEYTPVILNFNIESSNIPFMRLYNFITGRNYLLRFSVESNDGVIGCYIYKEKSTSYPIECGIFENGKTEINYTYESIDSTYKRIGIYRANGTVSQVKCEVYDLDSLLTKQNVSKTLTPLKLLYKDLSIYPPELNHTSYIYLGNSGSILKNNKRYKLIITKPDNGGLNFSLVYANNVSEWILEMSALETNKEVEFIPYEECGTISFTPYHTAINKFSFELYEILDTQNIYNIAQNIIPIKKNLYEKKITITSSGNTNIPIYNEYILYQKETYNLQIKRIGESSAQVEISIPKNYNTNERITVGTLLANEETFENSFVMPFESGYIRVYTETVDVEYKIILSHIVYTDISSSISSPASDRDYVLVAADNSNEKIKNIADFVCTGTNDEIIIQEAINYANSSNISKVKFANGLYNIDSFPLTAYDYHSTGDTSRQVAILLPSSQKEITLEGQNCEYGFTRDYRNGVCFYVTETAYNSVSNSPVSLLRGGSEARTILSGCAARISNIGFVCYGSQKPITMFDCTSIDRIYAEKLTFIGYGNELLNDSNVGLNTPPVAIPQDGFIALRMGTGSNDPQGYQFNNIGVWGFYEGIKVGGEHTIMIGCSSTICVYGWTFGNYEWVGKNQIVHPITMINCCDERNQYLMQLINCGYHQEVTMINHNVECVPDKTPGGTVLSKMTASENFCGQISFTAMTEWSAKESGGNRKDFKIWETGHGRTFKTINATHKLRGTTSERLTYSPNYMQHYYDTDLNKEIICIDPDNNIWVDTLGNTI